MGTPEADSFFTEEEAGARAVEALQDEIRATRGDPPVLVAMRWSRNDLLVDPRTALDALVTELGFMPLGEQWREIHPEIASSLGAAVLGQSLVSGRELLPLPVAAELANRFVRLFTEPRRCFSNTGEGAWPREWVMSVGWTSITSRTFDTGVALVTSHQVGILWAQEED